MQAQEEILSLIANYLNKETEAPIEPLINEALTQNPHNWPAFRALASVLEHEGNEHSAKECYQGNIPLDIQKRFFNLEELDELGTDSSSRNTIAHVSQETRTRSPSVNNTFQLTPYRNKDLQSAPTSVTEYRNRHLWSDGYNVAVFDENRRVDERSIIGNIGPVMSASRRKDAVHIKGQAVLMASKGSNNYYHWMTDILPKIEVLKKAGIETSRNTKYIFTNVSMKFQIETLQTLGIDRDQIYCTNIHGEHISADVLLIPTLSNRMGLAMGSWLPEYIKSIYNINRNAKPGNRKILISRDPNKSNGRGINNVSEFNQFFLDKGYIILTPENVTVAQQAALFSQASHVAATHGAGLANVLFCNKGTHIYEVYGNHLAPCYWAISELSGLDYENLNCSQTNLADQSDLQIAKSLVDRRSSNFSVPLSDIHSEFI